MKYERFWMTQEASSGQWMVGGGGGREEMSLHQIMAFIQQYLPSTHGNVTLASSYTIVWGEAIAQGQRNCPCIKQPTALIYASSMPPLYCPLIFGISLSEKQIEEKTTVQWQNICLACRKVPGSIPCISSESFSDGTQCEQRSQRVAAKAKWKIKQGTEWVTGLTQLLGGLTWSCMLLLLSSSLTENFKKEFRNWSTYHLPQISVPQHIWLPSTLTDMHARIAVRQTFINLGAIIQYMIAWRFFCVAFY